MFFNVFAQVFFSKQDFLINISFHRFSIYVHISIMYLRSSKTQKLRILSKLHFMQTFSVRTFWPAPTRTSHTNRNVQHMHPHAIFCARTRNRTRTFFPRNFLKNKFFTKNQSVRTYGSFLHLRGVHTRTRTHISEKNCRTHTCARTHTKGLVLCYHPTFAKITMHCCKVWTF